MNDRYPMVLFPAFKLQDTMQRCTLGELASSVRLWGVDHQVLGLAGHFLRVCEP
jgi:hypothetical protein